MVKVGSDTKEDGCDKTEFNSDAARLSELIAVAKAWTTSFSNNEKAVDSRGVGLASRIDDTGTFGNTTGTNAGPATLWGVWATNLLRHSDRANGYTCGTRHFGVVPFAGGRLYTIARRTRSSAVPEQAVIPSTPTTW